MNQADVKKILLSLKSSIPDFSVIFTGKKSKRVNGLYKPENCEILIHNRNFQDDNTLLYTAIHEFAHHVHFSQYPHEVSRRSHTNRFWDLFHSLLSEAENRGIYRNLFERDKDFQSLTRRIRKEYLEKNGHLMKEFGKLLLEALDLCRRKHAVFEDYTERILGMTRGFAGNMIKVHALDVDGSLGYENMKLVASINDPRERARAVELFNEGKTPPQVKQQITVSGSGPETSVSLLENQKRKLEKSISNLRKKLENINIKLEQMGQEVEL